MRRSIGLILVMLALAVAPPVLAAPKDQTAAQAAAASTASFRVAVRQQFQEYLTKYGNRLSVQEDKRVRELITQSDKDLARIESLTSSTASWERRGNRPQALKSASAAVRAYDASYARAVAAVDEMRPILQPHLNVFEGAQALFALDSRMAEYRALGTRLRAVETSLRTRT